MSLLLFLIVMLVGVFDPVVSRHVEKRDRLARPVELKNEWVGFWQRLAESLGPWRQDFEEMLAQNRGNLAATLNLFRNQMGEANYNYLLQQYEQLKSKLTESTNENDGSGEKTSFNDVVRWLQTKLTKLNEYLSQERLDGWWTTAKQSMSKLLSSLASSSVGSKRK